MTPTIPLSDLEPARPSTRLLRRTREVALLSGHGRLSHAYRVDLDRIPDAAALLAWIEHLSGKRWVKPQHIRELIWHAERENGITVDRGA